MGLSASSVADLSLEELRSAKFQLLFGSAKKVLEERLLNVMKDNCPSIHQKFGSSCNRRLTHNGDVDREKVYPHYEVQLS